MIEVKVSLLDYPIEWSMTPPLWESWVVGKLKEAGVPIKGTLLYDGLLEGTLTRLDDPCDWGAVVYQWRKAR